MIDTALAAEEPFSVIHVNLIVIINIGFDVISHSHRLIFSVFSSVILPVSSKPGPKPGKFLFLSCVLTGCKEFFLFFFLPLMLEERALFY